MALHSFSLPSPPLAAAAMALRRINPSKQPLLHLPRPFSSSSNPPLPPPPPPPSEDPDASPRFPPPNNSDLPQRPHASSLFGDLRERLRSSPAPRIPINPPRPTGQADGPSIFIDDIRGKLESFPNASGPFSALRNSLPWSIVGKELRERDGTVKAGSESGADDIRLPKAYSTEELGGKLEELRPPGAGKDGMHGRMTKLAKLETDGERSFFRRTSIMIKEKTFKSSPFPTFDLTGKPVYPPQQELLGRKKKGKQRRAGNGGKTRGADSK